MSHGAGYGGLRKLTRKVCRPFWIQGGSSTWKLCGSLSTLLSLSSPTSSKLPAAGSIICSSKSLLVCLFHQLHIISSLDWFPIIYTLLSSSLFSTWSLFLKQETCSQNHMLSAIISQFWECSQEGVVGQGVMDSQEMSLPPIPEHTLAKGEHYLSWRKEASKEEGRMNNLHNLWSW